MMRKAKLLTLAICIIFLLSPLSTDASRGFKITAIDDLSHQSGKLGEFKALIIGINDYKDPKISDLETAVNDANTMSKVLEEKYGFKVQFLFDRQATKAAIYKKLRGLAASTTPNDSVLIYFAGHGDLDRTYDDGWWIPSDATGGNPVTYLSNVQVQMAMRSMKARHVLLISDSCYAGTFFGKSRALPPIIDDKYYLGLYNEKSRWGMTSGNKGPVSDAGSEGHSLFAYQLLKELEKNDKPFISIQEIYTRIAPIVSNNSEQTPLCRPIRNTGDQGGEFVFVAAETPGQPAKKESIPDVSKFQKDTLDRDAMFWKSIQDSDDPALFQAYLQQFPNGTFAPIAKRKLKMPKSKKEVASISPDDTKPDPEILKAKLFVATAPADARVRILNIKPKFQQGIELYAGSYQIEVSARGYEIKKQWIKLGADEERRMSIELSKTPETGTIHVSGLPNKAKVFIDEDYAGRMPIVVKNVNQGKHRIRVEADGYIEKSEWLSLDPRENKTLDIRLKRIKKVVARDGRYEKYASGVVLDTKTGLEWYTGPDKDMDWNEVKRWVANLSVAGGGWRMPTMNELKTIFQKGAGPRNMSPLLKTTGWWVWSGEKRSSSSAWRFGFGRGTEGWHARRPTSTRRGFAVRSR
jgi:hypothetical protein